RVQPSDLDHSIIVLLAIVGRGSGMIALLAASSLALVSLKASLFRRAFVAAATILIGLIFVLASLEVVFPEKSQGVYMLPATLAAAFVVLPICAVLQLSALARERFDGALWLYLFAELTLAVILCQSSTGAWVNYAIPSAVIGSILIARIL